MKTKTTNEARQFLSDIFAQRLTPPTARELRELRGPRITLSPRENDTAREWCAGRRQSEIGRRLNISQPVVARHLARIRAKAGHPSNNVQLILFLVVNVPALANSLQRMGYKLTPIANAPPARK